jgi:phage tail-like protein
VSGPIGGTMQVMGSEIVPTGHRGHVDNLETPFPLIQSVPPMLAQDTFVQRMMPAFDEVLAPIISTLDCLDSYFDPDITPDDFLRYLSSWVNSHNENELSLPGLRHSVATAVAMSAWRGTTSSLHTRFFPYDLEAIVLEEGGGVTVNTTATDPETWPDAAPMVATVTITPSKENPNSIDNIIQLIKDYAPAHLQLTIVVAS